MLLETKCLLAIMLRLLSSLIVWVHFFAILMRGEVTSIEEDNARVEYLIDNNKKEFRSVYFKNLVKNTNNCKL